MTAEDAISYVLMTVTGASGPPSLSDAAKSLGIDPGAFDTEFGVVTINPDRHLYAVRVDASKLPDRGDGQNGPFSDPPIGPMGLL